jgi:hypothetical protein
MIRGFLLLFGMALVAGAAVEQPSTPIILSPEAAAKEGRGLAAQILSERPVQGFTNTGVLKIRDSKGKRSEVPIQFRTRIKDESWDVFYETVPETNNVNVLVVRTARGAAVYFRDIVGDRSSNGSALHGNETMVPFAGSDFWLADLGLEFLSWPEQHLLRKEIRRGQSCAVLESVNPEPAPDAYSRVLSWVDIDTDGIINAEAYDSKGKLLKEFAATSIKKVRGQWEVKGIEISNRQTGSRTTIEFDLTGEK